jgi:2,3-bisphosphoglycerate-independent phosphoglycerate mutase
LIGTTFKAIYVLLDGIGDLPHTSLEGSTPLEAAHTPLLDKLATKGSTGRVFSVGKGIAPQSDIAVFNMLGYDFNDVKYPGRGVVEALGAGMDFTNGDLVLRGNFATIARTGEIIDRRAGRIITKDEAVEICGTLEDNIKFSAGNIRLTLQPTIGHRVIVKFRLFSGELSDKISNTDPAYDRINGMGIAKSEISMKIQECVPQELGQSALISAQIVNEFNRQTIEILEKHPVNIRRIEKRLNPMNSILLRDSGNRLPIVKSIEERYGLKFRSVVDMPVEIGISKVIGMEFTTAGDIDAYEVKARKCVEKLEDGDVDVVYVHLKGPDEFGHDGDAIGKKKSIEEIDRLFFGPLLGHLDLSRTMLVISGDHSTPCIQKAHTDDPIPILFTGAHVQSDGSKRFTEAEALKGSIGLIRGSDILPIISGLFGKSGKRTNTYQDLESP